MTQEKAERLAREIASGNPHYFDLVKSLCNHILSGDHKREIENAAYERGYKQAVQDATDAQPCTAENPREDAYQHGRFDGVMDYGRAIRALIQPPAQKENGE